MANQPKLAVTSDSEKLQSIYHTCITGSHILHYNGVLDAFGHLSARHPTNPEVFIMPRNTAPANVSSSKDLVQYRVADASPVDLNSPLGYVERYIHSEIYKRFPEVNGVIHSHAPEIIPYTITSSLLRPCIHMAGFIGQDVPVFDISRHYALDDVRDLLIRNARLGGDLAEYLSKPGSASTSASSTAPDHSIVLMRGHGYTVAGSSLEDAIYRAVYAKENAAIQTTSLGLAHFSGGKDTEVQYLRDDELEDTEAMVQTAWSRAWGLWRREVEATELYKCDEE